MPKTAKSESLDKLSRMKETLQDAHKDLPKVTSEQAYAQQARSLAGIMQGDDLATKIKKLENKINSARADYYNNQPTMSDAAYDIFEKELLRLDPNNSTVRKVGSPIIQSEWSKARHQIPMGSLDKVNTPAELSDWAAKLNNSDWFVCEKLDGISINCVYDNGTLVQAITRGDSQTGENILSNVSKMSGVVLKIDGFSGSLRGEIVMKKSIHNQFFSDKANPRNAASGLSKKLDGVGVEHLNVLFYQVVGSVEFKTEQDQFYWLKTNKLTTPNHWIFSSTKDVSSHWRDYQDKKRNLVDYDNDGLVIRINDLSKQLSLGDKDLRPKGAIAFKFNNQAKESIIRSIVWQVGNSGRLTPVATVDPVSLAGATVTNASLYNIGYIQELGLDVGARVLVCRANDVIPRIEELIESTDSVAKHPANCPTCNNLVEVRGENLYCTNSISCPSQVVGRIKNWIAELNVLEWGDALVERLVESKKVNQVSDLYKLSVDDLMSLERMGKKSAQKCYDLLWENSTISLEVFLGALSIQMIGQSTIKAIMNSGCDTLDKFFSCSASSFENIPTIGPIRARELFKALSLNKNAILQILENGVRIKDKVVGVLTNKSVCFTGSMKNKRPVLEKMVVDAGGDVKNSVAKGLSYLVIADVNSTSSKAVAAKKFGTVLISEEDFLNLAK